MENGNTAQMLLMTLLIKPLWLTVSVQQKQNTEKGIWGVSVHSPVRLCVGKSKKKEKNWQHS